MLIVKCQKLGQSIVLPPIFLTCVAFCRLFDVPDQNDLIFVSDRLFDPTITSFFEKI